MGPMLAANILVDPNNWYTYTSDCILKMSSIIFPSVNSDLDLQTRKFVTKMMKCNPCFIFVYTTFVLKPHCSYN